MSQKVTSDGAPFDANLDAQIIHHEMKGAGTDEDAIIRLLAHRSLAQRKEIAQIFKAIYGKDLHERLKKELSGKFKQVVKWSFYDPAEVNAHALRRAMRGPVINENMLIDILCTANNEEINAIKEAFKSLAGKLLEEEIEKVTSGDFRHVLVALLQGRREGKCSESEAKQDADDFFKAGEKKAGTDESTFTRILCGRSYEQIRKIDEHYQEKHGHGLIGAIKNETSGTYKKALVKIVMVAKDLDSTIAEMLFQSMQGAGTDDESLIRVILAYSETRLKKVEGIFDSTYEQPLVRMIKEDTTKNYKKFLVAMCQ